MRVSLGLYLLPQKIQHCFFSAPQEGEQQSQHSKSLAELQARKNAIDITGAICRTANDLLHRAHNQPGIVIVSNTFILGCNEFDILHRTHN